MRHITLDDWLNTEDDIENKEVSFENMCANIKDEDAKFTFEYIYSIVNSEQDNNSAGAAEESYSYSYNNNYNCKTDKERRREELARRGISPGKPNFEQRRLIAKFKREARYQGYSDKEIDKVVKLAIDYMTS